MRKYILPVVLLVFFYSVTLVYGNWGMYKKDDEKRTGVIPSMMIYEAAEEEMEDLMQVEIVDKKKEGESKEEKVDASDAAPSADEEKPSAPEPVKKP